MAAQFLAKQLSNPSGLFGRLVLGPLWNRRNSALNDAALERLALRPEDRVLEVGFGGGYLLGRMAGALTAGRLAGIDISPAMVSLGQKRYRALLEAGRLELACAPAESLPFSPAHFTKAVSVNSIFYWSDPEQAFRELARVLQPGGLLVLCFTCRESMQDKEFARHGVALYELEQVKTMLEGAGFCQVEAPRLADRHREFWRLECRSFAPAPTTC